MQVHPPIHGLNKEDWKPQNDMVVMAHHVLFAECAKLAHNSVKGDIYSYGVVLLCMLIVLRRPPDSGAGRGRGMTLPSWMSGSNASSNGVHLATNNAPPSAPGFGQQPFLQSSSQQFLPGVGPPPGMMPGMGNHYLQFAQRPSQSLPPSVNFSQQQRPSPGPPQPLLPPNAVAVTVTAPAPAPAVVGVTPTFQDACITIARTSEKGTSLTVMLEKRTTTK
ncbi:hypothetical protein GOP47_0019914 [Adiantum capillus-veneris]|uniref:Protein kinase domain-containing protein n=1 Tax=Adiantum capillus-veneris TaxID=13818 RepID=A0A9D4UDD8_ADICA|nr:hypothetical protein GOP47_0019914 [Adiantum capillus-veneris]